KQPILLEPPQNVISSDSVEVCRQRSSRGIETSAVSHQYDEYFLSHVLCHRLRPAHMQRKFIDSALPPSIKRGERILVAGHHKPQQVHITGSRRQSHHLSVDASPPADTIDSREPV